MTSLHVFLSQTSHPGNIGAVARAMHVCGLSDLHLIDPQTEVNQESYDRATAHAKFILENAHTHSNTENAWLEMDRVYAFTNRPRDLNLPMLTLEQAHQDIKTLDAAKIGLLFGTERTGLTNQDLQYAHRCVFIPCQNSPVAMNLSHAVQTALYVLTNPTNQKNEKVRWPSSKQKDAFWQHLNKALEKNHFYKESRQQLTEQKIRTIFNRACLTHDELQLIHGMIMSLQRERDETHLS